MNLKNTHLYTSESDSLKGCIKICFEMLFCPNQILNTGGPGAELVKYEMSAGAVCAGMLV